MPLKRNRRLNQLTFLALLNGAIAVRKMESHKISHYHQALLTWFQSNGRQFPWRETSNPFHILIAEILLRMTGSANMLAAYEYLVSNYPEPTQMANARLEDLEYIIRPLGLHSRAKELLRLSQIVQEKYNGAIPESVLELQELPGVGRYIANSVACFSFGEDRPLIDGAIGRIIRRVFGLTSTKSAYLDEELWSFAESIIPAGRAVEYNLAIIDLGALVCRSRNPICCSCPLTRICVHYHC